MSIEAMRKALNYIENTEGELGIKLSCGDALREALAAQPPAAPVDNGSMHGEYTPAQGSVDTLLLLQARYVLKNLNVERPGCGYDKLADACGAAAHPPAQVAQTWAEQTAETIAAMQRAIMANPLYNEKFGANFVVAFGLANSAFNVIAAQPPAAPVEGEKSARDYEHGYNDGVEWAQTHGQRSSAGSEGEPFMMLSCREAKQCLHNIPGCICDGDPTNG